MGATVTALVDHGSFQGLFYEDRARGATTAFANQSSSAKAADSAAASDEVLMRRYQRGDDQALQQLYERHRAALHRLVRRLSPDTSENEEIAQETWMAVIHGRDRYRPQARFVTYLFSIARRRAMDRWRKHGRAPEQEPEAEELVRLAGPASNEPEYHTTTVALRAGLMTAVASLPILQREAFLLRAEGDLTLEEIGEFTHAGRETAKSRLRYALNRLRIALEPMTIVRPLMIAVCIGLFFAHPAHAELPTGWFVAGSAPNDYEFSRDASTAQSGRSSALIATKSGITSNGFGTLMQVIGAENYRSARWRMSGYLKTSDVAKAQMWMRVDGEKKILAFDNMDSRPVRGTTAWTRYEIVLDDRRQYRYCFRILTHARRW
jgi:RNA polymerase sigma-70 factor, ECF subfamily